MTIAERFVRVRSEAEQLATEIDAVFGDLKTHEDRLAALAKELGVELRFCKHCSQPFIPERKHHQFVNAEHRKEYNNRQRYRRN